MCFSLWVTDEMSFLKKLLPVLLNWPSTFICLKNMLTGNKEVFPFSVLAFMEIGTGESNPAPKKTRRAIFLKELLRG